MEGQEGEELDQSVGVNEVVHEELVVLNVVGKKRPRERPKASSRPVVGGSWWKRWRL